MSKEIYNDIINGERRISCLSLVELTSFNRYRDSLQKMTEKEWLECNDARPMVDAILNHRLLTKDSMGSAFSLVSDRKWWLFYAAVESEWWRKPPKDTFDLKRAQLLQDTVEKLADGRISKQDAIMKGKLGNYPTLENRIQKLVRIHNIKEDRPIWANYLRDIVGNPFSQNPIVCENFIGNNPKRHLCESHKVECIKWSNSFACPESFIGKYCNTRVMGIAKEIYNERKFDIIGILGDALEENGCNDVDIINHLRGPNCHLKGCWALDFILGKS